MAFVAWMAAEQVTMHLVAHQLNRTMDAYHRYRAASQKTQHLLKVESDLHRLVKSEAAKVEQTLLANFALSAQLVDVLDELEEQHARQDALQLLRVLEQERQSMMQPTSLHARLLGA